MKFTHEILLSPWHLITAALILIAWIALIVGKYDRKIILKSGIGTTVLLYVIGTFIISVYTANEQRMDKAMISTLEKNYEMSKAQNPGNPHIITAAMGAFRDNDSYDIKIYVGNYSPSETFRGSMQITLTGENDKVLREYTFDDLEVKPGEQKEIHDAVTFEKVEHYSYTFYPK